MFLWKSNSLQGNKVGYASLHEWIRNHKPKPCVCEECGKNKPYDVANVSGEYKRDIGDYRWLCRGCHNRSHPLKRNSKGQFIKKGDKNAL